MENWEENLRDLLSSYGYVNLEKLNKKLHEMCKEWVSIINLIRLKFVPILYA